MPVGRSAYKLFIRPLSRDDDGRRREFILNVILAGSLVLALAGFVMVVLNSAALRSAYTGESPLAAAASVVLFAVLLTISRSGRYKVSAYAMTALYLALSFYALWRWGISLAEGVLVMALTLVMASVLLGTRVGLVVTGLASTGLLALGYLQQERLVTFSTAWMKTPGNFTDAIGFSVTLGVITLVSWLSNREIERSLVRARRSEDELTKERDLLEVKVQERTRELEGAQREKIMQLSRFAEFGRLTSGIVHELVTPLTTVSLNLEQMHDQVQSEKLRRAIESTKRMERYIEAARKQLQHQSEESEFSLAHEVESAMEFLAPQAKKAEVQLDFVKRSQPTLVGNPIKFHQLVTNLISNAIDAYETTSKTGVRLVAVELVRVEDDMVLKVQDWGSGIPEQYVSRIFDPFFTLKTTDQGMGLGLSLVKDIVEHEFGGTIEVVSHQAGGTVFSVRLPLSRKGRR